MSLDSTPDPFDDVREHPPSIGLVVHLVAQAGIDQPSHVRQPRKRLRRGGPDEAVVAAVDHEGRNGEIVQLIESLRLRRDPEHRQFRGRPVMAEWVGCVGTAHLWIPGQDLPVEPVGDLHRRQDAADDLRRELLGG